VPDIGILARANAGSRQYQIWFEAWNRISGFNVDAPNTTEIKNTAFK